jgi:hypothetical protein
MRAGRRGGFRSARSLRRGLCWSAIAALSGRRQKGRGWGSRLIGWRPVQRRLRCAPAQVPPNRGSTTGVFALPPVGTCGTLAWSRESVPAARGAPHPSTLLRAFSPRGPAPGRSATCGTRRSEVSLPKAQRAQRSWPAVDAERMSKRCISGPEMRFSHSVAIAAKLRTLRSCARCEAARYAQRATNAVRLHLALRVAIVATRAGIVTNRHSSSGFKSLQTCRASMAARQRRNEPWSHFARYIRRMQGRTRAKDCR